MPDQAQPDQAKRRLDVALVEQFQAGDLAALCDITVEAIEAGGGFGWLRPPERDTLERYWRGVLVIPERQLFLAKLDGDLAGTCQLQLTGKNNEAQALVAQVTGQFVAPWARGHGLARKLIAAVEDHAKRIGIRVLNLDVRETQSAAIQLFESAGFTHWGSHPAYAVIDGKAIAGRYYYKQIT